MAHLTHPGSTKATIWPTQALFETQSRLISEYFTARANHVEDFMSLSTITLGECLFPTWKAFCTYSQKLQGLGLLEFKLLKSTRLIALFSFFPFLVLTQSSLSECLYDSNILISLLSWIWNWIIFYLKLSILWLLDLRNHRYLRVHGRWYLGPI